MLALSDHELARMLQDDVPHGDLTTESLAIGKCAGLVTSAPYTAPPRDGQFTFFRLP